MKLILSLVIDDIDRYDLNWKDEDFYGIIAATLKNPNGYDDVEEIDLIFDGQERTLKLRKNKKTFEANLKLVKEVKEKKSTLIAEIWPIIAA